MQLATILFTFWRKRQLVACAALLGLLAGGLVAFRVSLPPGLHSRQYDVGIASTRLLIDTPSSQIVAVDPSGLDTLADRADLIASLMVDGVVKADIASRVGVAPDRIAGIAESAPDQPAGPTPKPRGYVLSTNVLTDGEGNELPVVEISTQAPDASDAARLADAAVSGVEAYLAARAANETVPPDQRLQVIGLGPAQASEVVRGPGAAAAVAAGLFVFLSGCAAILLIPAVLRDWRKATEEERAQRAPEVAPAPAERPKKRSRARQPAGKRGSLDPSPVVESSASRQQVLARDVG